jgi:hypothetical protein
MTMGNNGSQEQVYRGEFIIQTKNPFNGVTSINIIKN